MLLYRLVVLLLLVFVCNWCFHFFFFFSSRRRHTRSLRDWSSDVCSSDLFGKRLSRPVVRSGGLGVGKVEELGLNALETRIYASIDGTKSGEELLRIHDASTAVRLLYLLTELGHLAFAEVEEETAAEPARAPAQPSAPQPAATPQPAKPAAAPPLPKTLP